MDFLMPFLVAPFLGTPTYFWLIFIGLVIALLVFDLGILHKEDKEISAKESFVM